MSKKLTNVVSRRSWKEFQSSGLLWFMNTFLHAFGWAIALEVEDDGTVSDAYPARVKYRGFDDTSVSAGYLNVTKYMKENAEKLLKEAKE